MEHRLNPSPHLLSQGTFLASVHYFNHTSLVTLLTRELRNEVCNVGPGMTRNEAE